MGDLAKILLLVGLASFAQALSPVEVQGQELVDSGTGKRFEIIGVDYQPGGEAGYSPASGVDPLSDGDICLRDAALMQRLGTNTIRAYNVNPYINHDACASVFNAVGIYMIIDVNSPLKNESLDRNFPTTSYTASYINRTFAVIEAFRNYPNLIGFFSGNEIVNDPVTASEDPPYIRAVTRDLKQYVAARGGRSLPIGYSAADVRDILVDTSNYLQCEIPGEGDASSRSDFFALNSYSWCGNATFQTSTYDQLVADFNNTTIPVFFSEFGCIVPSPRVFTEIPVLYGPMMKTWSGGLVYQWTEEGSPEGGGYGLVTLKTDGSLSITQDYNTLQTQYSKLDFATIESQNMTATSLKPPRCGADLIDDSGFANSFRLPAQPNGVAQMIRDGVFAATGSIVPLTKTAVDVRVTEQDGSVATRVTITPVPSAVKPTAGASNVAQISITAASSGATAVPSAAAGSSTHFVSIGLASTAGAANPAASSAAASDNPNAARGFAAHGGAWENTMAGAWIASSLLWLLG